MRFSCSGGSAYLKTHREACGSSTGKTGGGGWRGLLVTQSSRPTNKKGSSSARTISKGSWQHRLCSLCEVLEPSSQACTQSRHLASPLLTPCGGETVSRPIAYQNHPKKRRGGMLGPARSPSSVLSRCPWQPTPLNPLLHDRLGAVVTLSGWLPVFLRAWAARLLPSHGGSHRAL